MPKILTYRNEIDLSSYSYQSVDIFLKHIYYGYITTLNNISNYSDKITILFEIIELSCKYEQSNLLKKMEVMLIDLIDQNFTINLMLDVLLLFNKYIAINSINIHNICHNLYANIFQTGMAECYKKLINLHFKTDNHNIIRIIEKILKELSLYEKIIYIFPSIVMILKKWIRLKNYSQENSDS